jgi:hypothetical protein
MYYSAPEILTGAGGGFFKDANRLSIDMRNAVMMDNPKNVVVNIGSDQQTQGRSRACLNVSPIDMT